MNKRNRTITQNASAVRTEKGLQTQEKPEKVHNSQEFAEKLLKWLKSSEKTLYNQIGANSLAFSL